MAINNPPPRQPYPLISVIIPLFNAEKFIGACLESILNQTFQNFEVVIVDDCSTDNSVAIVQSFAEKFGGRLRLKSTLRNTGSGTEPRNLGLEFSRGEYVFFMDNDDELTPTALEELYSQAKKFDADVVHCEKYYPIPANFHLSNAEQIKYLKAYNYLSGEKKLFPEPLVLEQDIGWRAIFFSRRQLIWNYWEQLIRRDFLIEHSIKAVGIIADDMLFTICELCTAKKYVIVPNVIYLYRHRTDSLIHTKREPVKRLNLYVTMLRDGIKYLDEFFDRHENLLNRPDVKYILFNTFANQMIGEILNVYDKLPPYEFDAALRKIFGDGQNVALLSFIFNKLNLCNRDFILARQHIAKLENELKNSKQ